MRKSQNIYAGLAQEIGFDRLVNGIAKAAHLLARHECKECDLTSSAPSLFVSDWQIIMIGRGGLLAIS
jgi:hypothetical protein